MGFIENKGGTDIGFFRLLQLSFHLLFQSLVYHPELVQSFIYSLKCLETQSHSDLNLKCEQRKFPSLALIDVLVLKSQCT
jgi:hypothetical protein